MKKMVLTMMVALLVGTSAMAQDSQNDSRHPAKFDKTEMIKHRTDDIVSRYKLDEKQAKKLLELNTKYADKMMPRGHRHHGRHGAGRPPMPPKDDKVQRREPPKDGGKMKERRKEIESTMKAYDSELKKIMTDDQYKSYQDDQKKMREKHHRPRSIE